MTPAFRSSVEEHAARARESLAPLLDRATETLPLDAAAGRVTADAVASPVDLPLFTNSQMDGYAVRASDVASARASTPVRLPVSQNLPAGPIIVESLVPGTAARIMTGAPVPPGADAVIPVEDTDAGLDQVAITRGRRTGEYVRSRGSDARAGDVLLPAGTLLAPHRLAALAAAGITEVAVRSRARVAIVSTGSEVVEPGAPLEPGQLYDTNSVTLPAAARRAGAEVALVGRVTDDTAALAATLDAALAAGAELIVTSGGVSMGAYEVVRELLEPEGALVGTVAMQPGGPQAVGAWRGIPVLSFPGNPVSALLSFELFLAPVLRELAGLPAARRRREPLAHDVESVAGKRQFLRGRRGDDGIEIVAGPGSHLVAAMAASELLAVIPEYATHVRRGALVETVEL